MGWGEPPPPPQPPMTRPSQRPPAPAQTPDAGEQPPPHEPFPQPPAAPEAEQWPPEPAPEPAYEDFYRTGAGTGENAAVMPFSAGATPDDAGYAPPPETPYTAALERIGTEPVAPPPPAVPPAGGQFQRPMFVNKQGAQFGAGQWVYTPYGWSYQMMPQYSGPGNGLAYGGMITSIVSLVLLFVTAGLAAPLTLLLSLIGMVCGFMGKRAVDKGKTWQHKDKGWAGFWLGLLGALLSLAAGAAWVLAIVYLSSIETDPSGGDLSSLCRLFA